MKKILIAMMVLTGLIIYSQANACTITVTGKAASADGSVMVSHSDDGLNDARLIYVPAMGLQNRRIAARFLLPLRPGFQTPMGSQRDVADHDQGPGTRLRHARCTAQRGPGIHPPSIPYLRLL